MIDVQIVTYNSASSIEKCVRSVEGYNIQIWDNSSTDETVAIIEWQFPHISLHKSRENVGFGAAHNALKGENPFILLLNPDAELYPDTIECLLYAAKNSLLDVVAWEARQFPFEHPKVYDPLTLETEWVSGACVLLKRCAFQEVGGFDPKIFLYGEDVDLSFRLRNSGYKLHYCPKAKVKHQVDQKPKPHTYLYSALANLYIRTRFGSHLDIAKGLLFYTALLFRRYPLQMAKNLGVYVRNFWHFYKTRQRKIRPKFRFLDYTEMRLGAFYKQKEPKQRPKVSVLIRTIGQRCLEDALKSLENQTYENFEVVLIEDGPATWKGQTPLEVKYKALGKRRGRSVAGNVALKEASGDYFIFLDEDDLFFADHLEQLVAAVDKIAYSLSFEVPTLSDFSGKILKQGKMRNKYTRPFSFQRLLKSNYIPILNVLFHRSLYEREGGFDETLQGNEDWHLWVRYGFLFRPFAFVQKTTALYRVPLVRQEKWRRRGVLEKEQEKARKSLKRAVWSNRLR